jgi:hypothetical protein
MISNSFMVTISHSDSRLRLNCVGILYYSFAALEVNILTNILLLMYKSIFNINGPILFGLCFRLPIRQRPIRVALNQESYRSDSTETYSLNRNRFDWGHKLHRTEILTEITGLMSRDRMSASKCTSLNPENNTKTF